MLRELRDTLIDLKANRPVRLGARAHPRALVFVHVPKCGGSSVERALRRARPLGRRLIGPDETYRAAAAMLGAAPDDADRRHEVLMRASEMRRDLLHPYLAEGARLVTGHAPLGAHTLDAFPHADVVTAMRSPRARLRSHLVFNAGPRAGHGRTGMTLARFLETPRATVMGALYVKYLAGLPMTADLTTQGAGDAARRTVDRLALVGFTEDMEGLAANLSALAGARLRIGHENRGEDGPTLPDALSDRIHALCAPDDQVYAHARARFGERRHGVRPGEAREG